MKFLANILERLRKRKTSSEDELAELTRLEEEMGVPSREESLRKRSAVSTLRSAGAVYHHATLLYLRETQGTREEFDSLPPTAKEAYLHRARNLS